ncbi:MAG: succinate dehydrogenase, hydrophobic membrane anchor protein [Pseudomonadota bacterium]
MADMRTPLGKVRGLGSAKEGTDHFWKQRLTAVANVPLVLFFIWIIISLNGASHSEVAATLANPVVALVMLAVIFSVCLHMKLGMQVVIEDYIHSEGTKVALIILNIFFCVGIGLVSAFAVLKLGFGG